MKKLIRRRDFLLEPVKHIKINGKLTIDQLIRQFQNSGSFGAGRLSTACDIYERMLRDKECTVFLALAGAVVPAGMRSLVADLIHERLVDVVVSTGANMVHDAIEALGGHHYKGHWNVDDNMLYKYHIYRIYDVFVPEEDFVKLDYKLVEIYDEIAAENDREGLSSNEFAWELGKRLNDPNSILRAAYEAKVPIFLPAVRDAEFGFIYWLHSSRKNNPKKLVVNAFKDVPEICNICKSSPKNGMIVIGGGVPRNTVQSAALASKKGMDYAVIITMDRPETGGLSGSTLEETVSWGKVKEKADKVMVIGDAMIVFPIMVASVLERLGEDFKRVPYLKRRSVGVGGS
ncbi:MAG: deoxyhypusine synthase [Candidatus Bathyarchaeia archaeon]|nr:deoxyhypusine synthase [Candidatus Bathyarchaeota archaeon A05DMB-5]